MMTYNSKKIKNTGLNVVYNLFRYIVLIVSSYLLLYPFIYMIVGSFKQVGDFLDPSVNWVPKHLTFENITVSLKVLEYGKSILRTLLYGMIPAALQFCTSALAAYGLSRFRFKGRTVLMALLFLNILVPTAMTIIPVYTSLYKFDVLGILKLLSKLTGVNLRPNLLDTPFAFWIPSVLGVGLKGGLFIYIFMQFFSSFPKELEEAASIDGAGALRCFLQIIIPSSGAAAVTVILFSVIWNWGDSFLPTMFLSENFPLSVRLARLSDFLPTSEYAWMQVPVLLASCLLFLAPMILFYILMQKKFIASVTTSGITGM